MRWLVMMLLLAGETGLQAQVQRFDVLITEIMADPSPVVGLPNAEYLELKNVSSSPINLQGWKIADQSTVATVNTSIVLLPDSMIVFCSNSNVAALAIHGRTAGISSFPSLDNDGDVITLRSPSGMVIHAVAYDPSWYSNAVKEDGGWSLEMIDTENPCTGRDNWKASEDPLGGTPSKMNAVAGTNKDESPPALLRTTSPDSLHLLAIFDEPLDSSSAVDPAHYQIAGLQVLQAKPLGPLFQQVMLELNAPMIHNKLFALTVNGVVDCKGNMIGARNSSKAGWPASPGAADLVINEILFNPAASGYDYVEICNRSSKIIDLKKILLANRNEQGAISSPRKLSEISWYVFPGDYMVITQNREALMLHYLVKEPLSVSVLNSLPSYPDDEGVVVLTDDGGEVLDEVSYKDDWHFALISNAEGIALERLDTEGGSNDPMNWHSAASTAGYGTPGYENSQMKKTEPLHALISVSPGVVSPDNDGWDDMALVQYELTEPGYVASIVIFDAAGRVVRYLTRNALLGIKGQFQWDGLGEQRQQLPSGIYILRTEIFNTTGKKKVFKHVVVLGRKA